MSDALMRIVVDLMAFLELSDDDAVDPDAAVAILEWVAAALEQLPDDERRELVAYVRRESERAATDPRESDARRRFLSEFVAAFGLEEPRGD